MNLKKIFFFSFFFSFVLFSDPFIPIYYTYQNDPCRSVVVNLQTANHETILIQLKEQNKLIASAVSKGNFFELPADSRYIHHIQFEHLKPETLYDIEVFADNQLIKTSKIETLSTDLSRIKVVVGGDLEMIQSANGILEQIKEQNPSVIFFGGDYPKDVLSLNDYKKWDEWLKVTTETLIKKNGASIPWILAIGNNEVFGSFNQTVDKAPFFHQFFLQAKDPVHYFCLKLHPDFLLIILDSGLTATHDGAQKDWLIKTLKEYEETPIKMALYHVPIYPSVRFKEKNWYYRLAQAISKLKEKKNIASRLFSPQSMQGFLHWAPIFDQFNLLCAFEHHDHAFKRTNRIKNGKTDDLGTYYLGDGALAPFPQFTPIQKFFDFRLKKSIGHVQFFWLMTFQQDKIDFQAISSYGKSIDHFSIKGTYE